ncbi:MAG: hypothetical protein ACXAD7_28900, partial [Candidatus Kariarchaeaceae archaeon]
NSNSLTDYLEVLVNFNISNSGDYSLDLSLDSVNRHCGWGTGYGQRWYDVGQYSEKLIIFPNSRMYDCWTNENWTISSIRLYNEWWLINFYRDLSSIQLDPASFDLPFVFNPSNISSEVVDTNSNGLYDYLRLSVSMNVTLEANYRFYAQFSDWDTGEWKPGIERDVYLTPGYQQLDFLFENMFSWRDINSTYKFQYLNVQVELNGSWYWLEEWWLEHMTDQYSYTEFERPDAYFTGFLYLEPVSSNGSYEGIDIIAEIEVQISADYYFEWQLVGSDTLYHTHHYGQTIYLDVGVHNISLRVSGTEIKPILNEDIRINFVYVFTDNMDLLDEINWPEEPNIPANTYSPSDFVHPWGRIIEILSDYGEDLDDNGLIEYIIIPVRIEVFVELDYSISVQLSNGDYITSQQWINNYNDPGIYIVELRFSTVNLYAQGIDNINEINWLEFHGQSRNEGYWEQIDIRNNLPLTYIYPLTQFDMAIVHPLEFNAYMEDINNDSLWDNIVINFTVVSKVDGNFDFSLNAHDDHSGWWVGYGWVYASFKAGDVRQLQLKISTQQAFNNYPQENDFIQYSLEQLEVNQII